MRLSTYIRRIVDCLERHEPESAALLRRVVGDRVSRIGLDGESVDARFIEGRLSIRARRRAGGEGHTDRATAYALLDGTLDVHDALASGRLRLQGDLESLTRMWSAVEIVLDASTRISELRALSRTFRRDVSALHESAPLESVSSLPRERAETELELLARLDLLPDAT